MQTFVTALLTDVDVDALWGAMAPIAGLVGVGILVGFGVHRLSKVVRGLGKGKASI